MLLDYVSVIRENGERSHRGQETGNTSIHLGTGQPLNASNTMRQRGPLVTRVPAVRTVVETVGSGYRPDLRSPEARE